MKNLLDVEVPERPRKKPELTGEELEGMNEVIYVDAGSGSNYSLNIVAATTMELWAGTRTSADIAAIILDNMEADAERVQADTRDILEEFAAYGLIGD